MMRCRPGIVARTPSSRRSRISGAPLRISLALHRIRDTSDVILRIWGQARGDARAMGKRGQCDTGTAVSPAPRPSALARRFGRHGNANLVEIRIIPTCIRLWLQRLSRPLLATSARRGRWPNEPVEDAASRVRGPVIFLLLTGRGVSMTSRLAGTWAAARAFPRRPQFGVEPLMSRFRSSQIQAAPPMRTSESKGH